MTQLTSAACGLYICISLLTLFIGAATYANGKSHPYTYEESERAQSIALTMCLTNPCLVANLNASNWSCDEFNTFIMEQGYFYSKMCEWGCEGKVCNDSFCSNECIQNWKYATTIPRSASSDGGQEQVRVGTRAMIIGGCLLWFALLFGLVRAAMKFVNKQ